MSESKSVIRLNPFVNNPHTFLSCRAKTPVVRGARACTVCRAAKMKCVGAEDGQKKCQRCKRANTECVFEKHRRGRKPGSKLSEASRMLRRLEKGLSSAKKSHPSDPTSPYHADELRNSTQQDSPYSTIRSSDPAYGPPNTHFPTNELPPPHLQSYSSPDGYPALSNDSRNMDLDDDDDDADRNDQAFFPAKLIKRENQRNSFFRTILNPEEAPATTPLHRSNSFTPPQHVAPTPSGLSDPITAGIITEKEAITLFDAIFLRLNPFINLFDPALHTVSYVRSKCPFLFTTLIMAGCKFFKADRFKQCQKLANEFAVRAFAEAWKRVEVVQAFACLTYWKDPDDSRTWTFIGYACRMAVELGLNRFVANPSASETELHKLERRNRERTYLVLFVHDRSLSIQTGRHWMLPEDDLVRHAKTWHEGGGSTIRPEDVVIAAFVSLRRIAAETTEIFNSSKGSSPNSNSDINYDVVLSNCNIRLTKWDDDWRHEMGRAGGEKFHLSFLTFFRLHVRLFLNSFGIQASMLPGSRQPPSMQALSTCCTSALDSLRIVSKEFPEMHQYGQDSITVMTAYSAVFLLKVRWNVIFSLCISHILHRFVFVAASKFKHIPRVAPGNCD
ncbi:fungal-specific transcription factor domain-containing protein [Crassisporium funariophilum]|nr:fungal-specific transcription factor domain-containing protein [Crassisporium funariophilum]